MPGFNGTGPLGMGPMTGRGMGYCIMPLTRPGAIGFPYGYAGAYGLPRRTGYSYFSGAPYYSGVPFAYNLFWPRGFGRGFARGFGRGWGRGFGRGRGRWFYGWGW